jgi:hypothetical protein
MDHLMRDAFGPPDDFGSAEASAQIAADRERSDSAITDIARDAELDLERTLNRLAAIQLRASSAVAGNAAGLEVVGKRAPVLNAEEELDLAVSRLSQIRARAAVAVDTAARVSTKQAAEFDTASLKAHLEELRRLKREVEEESASELIQGIQKLERLSSRAHSASLKGKGLEVRGVAIPAYQRSFDYDADATESLEVRGVAISACQRSVGHEGNAADIDASASWEEEYDDHHAYEGALPLGGNLGGAFADDSEGEELLLQTVSSQGALLNAIAAKVVGMESAVSMGTVARSPLPTSSQASGGAAGISSLEPMTHRCIDPGIASAALAMIHAEINELIEEDEAGLPFLLRLIHDVCAMRGPMAPRQRTALLQLVRQVAEAGDEAESPLLADGPFAASLLEEEEQADDICDDRYEDDRYEDDLCAEEEEGEETEDGRDGARVSFDTFTSLDDIDEDSTPAEAGGYDKEDEEDRALDAQEVTERVHAMARGASLSEISTLCSQLGLPSSGTRQQLLSRLVSHLQTERETAELDVYYEEEDGGEEESTGTPLPAWPSTRQPSQPSAPAAQAHASSPQRPAATPKAIASTQSAEAVLPASTMAGKRPRAFGGLAGSSLQVHVSGSDLGASFRSDDSDRPKTARGQPGVDPFHYVSPAKTRPTSAPRVRSAASRAAPMPMLIQRLTISAATPPACSPLGSPFGPAIASADEAFAVEDEDDDDNDEDDDQLDLAAAPST